MSSCATALIVMATILGPITLVFMAVSFGTDYWLEFDVERSTLNGDDFADKRARYTHTRYRGLFRECYPGNDTTFLDTAEGVVDGYCFNVEYDLPDSRSGVSDDYLVRIHLLRLFLAFYIVALVFFVTAFVFGLILCCWRISRWAYVAGLCAYIAAFSVAAAIAFFHGAEYLERNKLTEEDFYKQWSSTIKQATRRSYGWSYALGWVGMILAAFTATFYSLAGCYITSQRYEDRERLEKDPAQRGGRDFPIAMEPVYAMEDPYLAKGYGTHPVYPAAYPTLGHPRAYPGPYLMAPDNPRYAIGYGDPQRDIWTMREAAS
ncbi:uncharacterized protein LOC143281275 [Babylonia areolata]|uniref:uncharacterized protein LOC143281275 n=1 Tax=Babylonia areolata TaxID=304850 RepID=UPI003FD1028D